MVDAFMDAVEVFPTKKANASIIWMHGLGASGDDFLPILDSFNLHKDLQVRFIFPNAPIRPITVNNQMKMRAWYDIGSFEEMTNYNQHNNNHKWLEESAELINKFIQREIDHGIPTNMIVLMGFSQGGALALHTGLRCKHKLGGIICLSGYLPWHHLIEQERNLINQTTPILFAHGNFDPIIPINLSKQSYDLLEKLSYNIEWHSYLMPHTIIYEEIADLSKFLNKVLSMEISF